jgi:protein-disulfide isomerase
MPMKPRYQTLAFALSLCVLSGMEAAAQPPPPCQALDDSGRGKLIDYVQKKYKLPTTTTVEIAEAGFVNESCYRKLDFHSGDARKPLNLTLFASPDLRFLSRDLSDVRVDPALEERRQKQELLARLSTGGAPLLGAKDAPVTVTVFSDFQCPFCSRAAKGLTQDILPEMSGAVRLEYRNFPLPMHAWARAAAEAAACARQQGDRYFWSFHDYFFEHQKELKPDTLTQSVLEYAAGLSGFNAQTLSTCLEQKGASAAVERDVALGKEIGVTGTPTMFVNGERLSGYRAEQLRAMIERAGPSKEETERQLAK